MSGGESAGAALGRRLLRRCARAALATSLRGAPYASLVLTAADLDASPLLLLSDIAQHSRNIAFDPRVSLLFDGAEAGDDRLDGPRLSVLGQARRCNDPGRLARFTRLRPSSARYARFSDFQLYRVAVERAHLVAGFGRIEWIDGGEFLLTADLAPFAAAEAGLLDEINRDHRRALEALMRRRRGRGGSDWQVVGLDPEGADLRCAAAEARIEFAAAVTAAAARAALLQLAAAE